MKATAILKAWTTSKWSTIIEVAELIEQDNAAGALSALHFTNHNMTGQQDWTEVGTAEVTVTFYPRDTVAEKELEGLQAQLQEVRAENQMRENAILDRISKLQAITYVSEAT
jgi:hypothetical protein